MEQLKTIFVDIGDIIPLPNNAKNHTKQQIEAIKNSILAFGFNDPLGLWQDAELKAQNKWYSATGNGTLEAATELVADGKLDRLLPCNDLSHLSNDEMRAYAIAHNATTLQTGFNLGVLEAEIGTLNYDFSSFGLDVNFSVESNISGFSNHNLPPELQGKDLTPEALPDIQGDFPTLTERIVISYTKEQKPELEKLLGIEIKENRVVYSFEEFKI